MLYSANTVLCYQQGDIGVFSKGDCTWTIESVDATLEQYVLVNSLGIYALAPKAYIEDTNRFKDIT